MSSPQQINPKALVFGPVPSRRLGYSLGVDLVPYKVCTLDCVYCQLNRTTLKTIERKPYVPVHTLLSDLKIRLEQGVHPDVISLTGSGEPTLNSGLGDLIDGIRSLTSLDIAVITNGTLFYREDVRAECAKADIVLPSLDAVLADIYENVNRPHPDLTVERQIDGLAAFRNEFKGHLWLEVFLVENLNTGRHHIESLKHAIAWIRPDKVQLNTAVRPTSDAHISGLSLETMQGIAEQLGPQCEIIADFVKPARAPVQPVESQHVVDLIARHPCTLTDICFALGIKDHQAQKLIDILLTQGALTTKTLGENTYFQLSKV